MEENQVNSDQINQIIAELQRLLEEITKTRRKIEQALQPYQTIDFYAEPS